MMKKINLIFPVAGEATRFGGTFKPFLHIGDITFIETTYEPFKRWKNRIDTVYFICTEEQEREFNVTDTISKLIDHKVKVIKIKGKTSGPYQTLKEGISLGDIKGPSIVCDCDHTLDVDPIFRKIDEGSFDAVVPTWEISDDEWMNWSKIIMEKDEVKMVCEKERITSKDYSVRGIIGCILFNQIENLFHSDSSMYVSDALTDLLLEGKILKPVSVENAHFYGDEDMLENYVDFLRKRCSILCDIDGVLIKHRPHSDEIIENNLLLPGVEMLSKWKSEGHLIIITTARSEKFRNGVSRLLTDLQIPYDRLIMGLRAGPRFLINDQKPSHPFTSQATAVRLDRDTGLSLVDITHVINSYSIKTEARLEGNSFSEVHLLKKDNKLFVRKSIKKNLDNEIHVEKLKRQKQDLERFNFMWKDSTPEVLKEMDSDSEYFYDMEYLKDYDNLSDFNEGDTMSLVLEPLLEKLNENVYCYKKEIDGVSWLTNHLNSKILSKLNVYEAQDKTLDWLINSKELTINGKVYRGLRYLLCSVDTNLIKPRYVRPVHGDLTLENILYDKNTGKTKLIDMDGSDFMDVVELDLGKISQSLLSNYSCWKNLKNAIFEIDDEGHSISCESEYFYEDSSVLNIFPSCIFEKWKSILLEDDITVASKSIFYMCLYFIRFIPFRMQVSRDHGIFAMIMAIVWLSKLLENRDDKNIL